MGIKEKDLRRLYHMLQYCRRITHTMNSLHNDFRRFIKPENYVHRDAICFYFLQLGELERGLTDEFKEKRKDVPWHKMRGLRNLVAHNYGDVDFDIIWQIAREDLPVLDKQLETILQQNMPDFDKQLKQDLRKDFGCADTFGR